MAERVERLPWVIRILSVVASPPNRRTRPLTGDREGNYAFWFDGGAALQHTGGGTHYEFDDGARAWQASHWEPGYPDVIIGLPDGVQTALRYSKE